MKTARAAVYRIWKRKRPVACPTLCRGWPEPRQFKCQRRWCGAPFTRQLADSGQTCPSPWTGKCGAGSHGNFRSVRARSAGLFSHPRRRGDVPAGAGGPRCGRFAKVYRNHQRLHSGSRDARRSAPMRAASHRDVCGGKRRIARPGGTPGCRLAADAWRAALRFVVARVEKRADTGPGGNRSRCKKESLAPSLVKAAPNLGRTVVEQRRPFSP